MIKKILDTISKGSLVHVFCSYPYRRELNDVGLFPPLALEFIAKVIQPFSKQTEIVDMRKEYSPMNAC